MVRLGMVLSWGEGGDEKLGYLEKRPDSIFLLTLVINYNGGFKVRKFDFLFKKHSFLVDLFCSGGIIAIRESITTLRKKPIHNRQSARTVLRPETKNVRNHSIFLGDNK